MIAKLAALAAVSALAAVGGGCAPPGRDFVRYPSGCIRVHPSQAVELHDRNSHGWTYLTESQSWWNLDEGVFWGMGRTWSDAIWQGTNGNSLSNRRCMETDGQAQT